MRYRHIAPRWLIPLAALLTGCRSPTEVELVLSTDVPCTSFKSAAIFVGSTEDAAESLAPLTVGYLCQDGGQLGTIFVIPAGDSDQSLFIRIVVGVGLDATRCTEDDPDRQCIVARRRLAFVPHEHLTLPIALDSDCAGRACQASETCEQGTCVDASLDPHACNADPAQCDLPTPDGAAGQGGSGGQGGAGQAGASGGSGQAGASGGSGQAGAAGGG